MGTRSTVKFYEDGEVILSVYQQYDGYPTGVGKELADFLNSKTIISGFSGQTMETHANGIGCLAAQFVKEFKRSIGGLYITNKSDTQSYNYRVFYDGDRIIMTVNDDFSGTPDEFLEKYCKSK
jgi:hypothetical protein